MSRIGKKPVAIPAGVEVNIDGSVVTVKGPKGTLTKEFNHLMKISKQGDEVIVERPDEENLSKSLHGLTRTLIHNMVEGVTNGFSKELKINGVGYSDPRLLSPRYRIRLRRYHSRCSGSQHHHRKGYRQAEGWSDRF